MGQLETLNDVTLSATVKDIAEANQLGVRLAVLHGAGSFGHFQAKKYGISKGSSHPQWAFGFADTRRAVTKLNHEVVSRLLLLNVPAVGVSPFPTTTTASKALKCEGSMAEVSIGERVSGSDFGEVLGGNLAHARAFSQLQ